MGDGDPERGESAIDAQGRVVRDEVDPPGFCQRERHSALVHAGEEVHSGLVGGDKSPIGVVEVGPNRRLVEFQPAIVGHGDRGVESRAGTVRDQTHLRHVHREVLEWRSPRHREIGDSENDSEEVEQVPAGNRDVHAEVAGVKEVVAPMHSERLSQVYGDDHVLIEEGSSRNREGIALRLEDRRAIGVDGVDLHDYVADIIEAAINYDGRDTKPEYAPLDVKVGVDIPAHGYVEVPGSNGVDASNEQQEDDEGEGECQKTQPFPDPRHPPSGPFSWASCRSRP